MKKAAKKKEKKKKKEPGIFIVTNKSKISF